MPILTRIYSPDNFGFLAIYLAIVGIISTISAGKYELAIILPKKENEALNLLSLSLFLNFFIFIFNILLYIFLKIYFGSQISLIFMFIPFGIMIESLILTFNNYNLREKNFSYLSKSKILRSASVGCFQILFFYLGYMDLGLIFGILIGISLTLYYLILPFKTIFNEIFNKVNKDSLITVAKKYINFPKYQAVSTFINALSQNSILLLLSFFYGSIIVGYYSLAHRLLKMPISLISDSIRQIFYKEGADLLHNDKNIYDIYRKTTIFLFLLAIPVITIAWNFLPILFMYIFGTEWIISGEYAQILIFWIFFLFINPPSIASVQLLSLQKEYMYYETLLLSFRILAIFLGYYYYSDILISLKLFTLISVLFNIILMSYIFLRIKSYAR